MWFFYRRETSSYKFLLNSHLFDLRLCNSCGVLSRDGPLIEIPFYRQSTSKPSKGISPTIGYWDICPSLVLQNCHGRYHHSRKPLLQYIKENKLGLVLSICFILHCACIFFSPNYQTAQARLQMANWKSPKNTIIRAMSARWAHSISHWYDHLVTAFVSSTGLEEVIAHIEALSKFTQAHYSQQSLSY